MPTIRPFKALRYDSAAAGPLESLVAPPYDVITPAERLDYLGRSPYNVVHLTLPDSEQQAAGDLAEWRRNGVLVEAPSGYWWVAQDYTGPDGVARTREGFAAAVPVEPYEAGEVLPHERTHAGPKEGRLRLLRATRTQLEPIFLLYDADPLLARPSGEPAADVTESGVRTRLWPVEAPELDTGTPLLIADGHHRYETALAYRERSRAPRTRSPSSSRLGRPASRSSRPTGSCRSSARFPGSRSPRPATASRSTVTARLLQVETDDDFGPRVVESLEPVGVSYTPSAEDAVAAVDRGEAAAAFLLEPVTVAQVARFAAAGETMPQKSTFFYPKLTSGLLLYPVDA